MTRPSHPPCHVLSPTGAIVFTGDLLEAMPHLRQQEHGARLVSEAGTVLAIMRGASEAGPRREMKTKWWVRRRP